VELVPVRLELTHGSRDETAKISKGAVTNRCVLAHPLPPWLPIFDALLYEWQCTVVAERISSPTRTFPLGDFQARSACRKTPKECCLSILIVQNGDQDIGAGTVPRSEQSARPRLLESLRNTSGCKIILVRAPAGYRRRADSNRFPAHYERAVGGC
jgi:hypothetical protein